MSRQEPLIPRPQGISIGDFDGKDVVRINDYTSSKSNEDDNENLRTGDSEINEVYNFTVVGIGAVSDYNSPLKNLSDASVDSNSFGLLFVTESAYDELNESKTAMKYFSMPNMHPEVSPFMIAYALIFPPVLSAIVNALVIRSRLNRTPLSLLKNEQSFPFYIYVMIYVIIIVLYLIINNALVGKIKKMVPAEVLKNRE